MDAGQSMAKINVSSSGTVIVADGDKVRVDIPGGGTVTIQAEAGGGVVDVNIDLRNNDLQSDVVNVDLGTFSENDLHIDVKNYDPSDQINLTGASFTGLAPGHNNELTFSYVGSDGATYTGFAHIKDKGQNDFTADNAPLVICFTQGTMILTEHGERPVEDLAVGDLVQTQNSGLQPIRWISSRHLDSVFLAGAAHMNPVLILAGALRPNVPSRDLLVSPQHRMCLEVATAQLLFGSDRVLVAAKHLINDRTIREARDLGHVTYFHMLFDAHQIVFANGAPSESLHTGDVALSALDKSARDEVLELFPELINRQTIGEKTAYPVLKSYEVRVLDAYNGCSSDPLAQ